MKSCLAVVMMVSCGLLGSAPVWADADEASAHAGLLMGAAAPDTHSLGPGDAVPAAGLSGRLTYATSDWYAFEVAMEFEHSIGMVRFDGPPLITYPGSDHERGEGDSFVRRMDWFRTEAGISARLGVRWIPTFYAGLGVQVQRAYQATEFNQGRILPGPGREVALDVAGVAGVGLDYRLDEHWVVGAGVRARRSLSWSWRDSYAASVAMHVGYYWYPGNLAR
jgi:hypothetical protein